jgi:hypothetical protein
MKILRIKFSYLRNEEWFQLFTEFKDLVQASGEAALDITACFFTFLSLYVQADEALDLIRKSENTDRMEDADMKRDQIYRGLVDAIKSALNHFNAEKKQAAKTLSTVIANFGNLADGVEGTPFLLGDRSSGWVGPGHNAEIIRDDKGCYFILYHAIAVSKPLLPNGATRRPLMMDEIV